ncbi:MAG TPA: 8-amino-7-oxononanoate synthase [Candidatus Omnitrophota bacterium]|nr:8-amino-7-oxononanoate synthase [Candidatus Omnitrophota bacterium]
MEQKIGKYIKERGQKGLLRKLVEVSPKASGMIRVGESDYINFSSNDYLGLASHPDILEAARVGIGPFFGTSASRLMSGTTELHAELEKRVAEFKKKPAALVMNSGYQANVSVIPALVQDGDVIFSDKLNHASIVDGIRLSGAKLFRFAHNDVEHLSELLKKERDNYRHSLIVTETVFSMDGDIAPLREIADLKKKYGSMLMVDEAHATGILGGGRGYVEECGLSEECDIVMGTFSKALGSFGAYIATTSSIKEFLVNSCRGFIYSTSLPGSVINANIKALDLVINEPWRRETLIKNSAYFREKLIANGFKTAGATQIIPIIVGDNDETVRMSELLKKKGYWVTPVRPPTVPNGTARLRLSVTYDHSTQVLDNFLKDIIDVRKDVRDRNGL